MNGNDFIFDSVQIMYYKCHKVFFIRSGSCIDSRDQIEKKKATINPENVDDKFFQYAAIVALNYEEINDIQRDFQILNHLQINIIGK